MKTFQRLLQTQAQFFLANIKLEPRISLQQQHFICQQLSFALSGGMQLPTALLLVGTELTHPTCRRFLLETGRAVQQGQSMAQAMRQSRIRYSPVLLEFVLTGEQNGKLAETLEQAADYFQKQTQIRQMLCSALFYPIVLFILMHLAIGAMFLFVVPAIVQTYASFDAELPWLTQKILQLSGLLKQQWPVLLLGLAILGAAAGAVLHWALQQPAQKTKIKRVLLHLPLLGRLYQQYWFIQIGQALGLMLSGGMLLPHCLQAIGQIYRRSLFEEELEQLHREVAQGHYLGDGLQHCSFLPKMARQLLMISEQSGALPAAFLQLSGYYQQNFQKRMQTLIGLLEPCFIILLGLAVLLMTGSLFLPMLQSYQYLL